jgi:hypothetical protein
MFLARCISTAASFGPVTGIYLMVNLQDVLNMLRQLQQRCTSRAQCAMMCAAVPCTRARDGTARHVAGEGRAASTIGGEDERPLSERDR